MPTPQVCFQLGARSKFPIPQLPQLPITASPRHRVTASLDNDILNS
ncbi:MAG: hypothetical protein F6K31_30190 [Symploca sp. SIO2G7]|nr:hypothetical protein [Symploca sp. SIO2G7]